MLEEGLARNCQKPRKGSQPFGFGRFELHQKVRQALLWPCTSSEPERIVKTDASQSFECLGRFRKSLGDIEMKLEEIQQCSSQNCGALSPRSWNTNSSVMFTFYGFFLPFFEMALLLAQKSILRRFAGSLACGANAVLPLDWRRRISDVKIVRPVNQIIKTDRIRSLVQDFSVRFEGSQQVFLSSKMRIRCMYHGPIL